MYCLDTDDNDDTEDTPTPPPTAASKPIQQQVVIHSKPLPGIVYINMNGQRTPARYDHGNTSIPLTTTRTTNYLAHH